MTYPKIDFTSQSYRDRDGFITIENKIARRYIHQSYADHYNQLMSSGLYDCLVAENLLIPHQEISNIEIQLFTNN